jgi:hypothetical protein
MTKAKVDDKNAKSATTDSSASSSSSTTTANAATVDDKAAKAPTKANAPKLDAKSNGKATTTTTAVKQTKNMTNTKVDDK